MRANVPLLRARNWFDAYRKVPSRYTPCASMSVAEPVNAAVRTQTGAGAWRMSLDVRERKVVVDENNVETENSDG